jgi:hypothetical protein
MLLVTDECSGENGKSRIGLRDADGQNYVGPGTLELIDCFIVGPELDKALDSM